MAAEPSQSATLCRWACSNEIAPQSYIQRLRNTATRFLVGTGVPSLRTMCSRDVIASSSISRTYDFITLCGQPSAGIGTRRNDIAGAAATVLQRLQILFHQIMDNVFRIVIGKFLACLVNDTIRKDRTLTRKSNRSRLGFCSHLKRRAFDNT
jgi:hypothetical protein